MGGVIGVWFVYLDDLESPRFSTNFAKLLK